MSNIEELLDIMSRLRDPVNGCPWDTKQTFSSVAPYTIEEAYEVADAVNRGDLDDLRDELGDLLLNVVFHAQMASESGVFSFEDVVSSICAKMVRRHPHVFSDGIPNTDGAELNKAWEQQKADERAEKGVEHSSALAGVALALPALLRAQKLGKRAARVGFDWKSIPAVNEKIREELAECEEALRESPQRIEEEVGDLLFAVTNLARHTNTDAEVALRKANDKFQSRFEYVEKLAYEQQLDLNDCDAETLDQLWQQAKNRD